ncbi:MAG: acyl-CoA dehydrogenase, partial [Streptosporangiales bacterium]|nr:acyl-CoA dehydrogenase [Streptosporangiales bacterium]
MSTLVLSAEQEELVAAVRDFCASTSPMTRVREIMKSDTGYDAEVWRRISGELGLTGLAVPEKHGGSGYGISELAVVAQELGAALVPGPFLASAVLAGLVLTELSDDPAAAELLAAVASGATIATLALDEGAGTWDPASVTVTARADGDSYVLYGRKPQVLDGLTASEILVVARLGDAPAVFAVRGDAVRRTALASVDPTRRVAAVDLDGAPARLLGPADAGAALATALDRARVVLAGEQLGVARRALDVAVEYAKIRYQFGRPIGSFQAVRHGLADVYTDIEIAESLVRDAAWAADHEPSRLPVAAATVQAHISPVAFNAAAQALQYHGGIGFTWEHDAHLYFKRAKTDEHLLGDGTH